MKFQIPIFNIQKGFKFEVSNQEVSTGRLTVLTLLGCWSLVIAKGRAGSPLPPRDRSGALDL